MVGMKCCAKCKFSKRIKLFDEIRNKPYWILKCDNVKSKKFLHKVNENDECKKWELKESEY